MTYARAPAAARLVERTDRVSAPLLELLIAMQRRAVAYCYWKSSRRAGLALAGGSDLDLLVARRSREAVLQVLAESGFKPIAEAPWRSQPGTASFVGYDEPRGHLVHVHLHLLIVLGDALLKTWHFPFEEALLARSVRRLSLPVRILDPIDEALLAVLRSRFELGRIDPVAARRRAALTEKFALDIAALSPRIEIARLEARAREFFSPALARDIASAFACAHPLAARAPTRRRIEQELAPYAVCGGVERAVRFWARAALWACERLNRRFLRLPRLPRRRPLGAGLVVAVVGVDGSGKSTLVANLTRWLEEEFCVLPIYFGTGQGRPSLFFLPFKLAAVALARCIKTRPRGASHGRITDRPPGLVYSVLFAVWATAIAIEKRHKLRVARRAAARGFIVVADRYPQRQDPSFNDGPMLPRLTRAPARLRRFEASTYDLAQRAPPDLLIKLYVRAETVERREPEMNARVARARVDVFSALTFGAGRIVSIDAEQSLDAVVRQARRAVWSCL